MTNQPVHAPADCWFRMVCEENGIAPPYCNRCETKET